MASQTDQKSVLNVVMGAMTFGEEGKEQTRVTVLEDAKAILDVFQSHGHAEVDTARAYGSGTSEEYLGNLGSQERGLKLGTKLYPAPRPNPLTIVSISHSPEDLRKHLMLSLKALKTEKLEIWYLHAPDRHSGTPYLEVMRGVNDLYKEGYFKRFGISNFMSWEVAELCYIAKQHGWVQPTVYQGLYNAIHRAVEQELFPCLRKFGLSFYAFNTLGGGFFTGSVKTKDDIVETRSRGASYHKRYQNDGYFEAVEIIEAAANKHGLTMAEVALRWISNHSFLKRELGDSVIIGASSLKHIEQNLLDLEKGPLPEDIVEALNNAWMIVKGVASTIMS